MLYEKIKKLFLIPSLAQWSKWSLPAKYSAVGLMLTIISLFYAYWLSLPQEHPKKAYDLSQPRRDDFLMLLKIAQNEQSDTLRVGCLTWSEASCSAAGKFLILFSEAGWKIDSDRVFQMDTAVPVDGMTIAANGGDTANGEKLSPHLGRWAVIGPSQIAIQMIFKYMDNPVSSSRDPSLPPRTLGIYFGPEPSLFQTLTQDQKNIRKPLIGFLSTAITVEQICSLGQKEHCRNTLNSWESEVLRYLQKYRFDPTIISEWNDLSKNTKDFSIENLMKQKGLLTMIFFGK